MISIKVFVFVHVVFASCVFGDKWCFGVDDDFPAPSVPTLDDASSRVQNVILNGKMTLFCCFISTHPVQVNWYKGDSLIMAGAKYQLDENNQVLSVAKAAQSDDGAYRCEGQNEYGRQSWNIMVNTHLPLCQDTPSMLPTVFSPQPNVTVKKGKAVNLTCIVIEREDCRTSLPSFYWRNHHGIIAMKRTKTVREGNNDVRMTLTIKRARKHHAGAYKCITSNAQTHASSKVWLSVVE